MRVRKFHLPLIIVMAAAAFVASAYVGIDKTLNWLLLKDANSMGLSWAHHMDNHLPHRTDLSGKLGPAETHGRDDLATFADDILLIEGIYQIDFIGAHDHAIHSFGGFPVHGFSPSEQFAAEQNHRHDGSLSEAEDKWQLPLDSDLATQILRREENHVIIRRDAVPHQPTAFAEIYHPIQSDAGTIGLVRILLNLEARATRYRNTLITGSLILLIVVALFCTFPARQFLRIRKSKIASDGKARFLATHDLMTGLFNRNAFQDRASRILGEFEKSGQKAVLFFIDIDGFKDINDFYGHDAGDQLLKQVAGALERNLPDNSLIARMGGDEFAALAPADSIEPGSEAKWLEIPDTFEINLSQRLRALEISIAVGLVRFPRDGTKLRELMLNADLAWYNAKKSNCRQVFEFSPDLRQQFQTRIDLLRDFSRALEAGQIVPHYQALICTATGRVRGFEALARWQHPTKGLLTPAHFHEALEDSQIARSLGTYMLNAIAADMDHWKSKGVAFETVGLNVTDADLLRSGFSLDVIAILSRYGFTGEELAIEVTENCLFGGDKAVIAAKLKELRTAGCHVALDDFGTGYSSVTHIKDMPVSAVKIDKSFICEIANDKADQAIVRALVDMGEAIGFKLVAEGVETEEQQQLVQALGCHLIQGFYYSKPVPASDVPNVIATFNRRTVRMAG